MNFHIRIYPLGIQLVIIQIDFGCWLGYNFITRMSLVASQDVMNKDTHNDMFRTSKLNVCVS